MKKTVPVADATPAQLREFGNSTLGLSLAPTSTRALILAKFAEVGFDKPEIEVEDTAAVLSAKVAVANAASEAAAKIAAAVDPKAAEEAARAARDVQTYEIMIDVVDEPGGNRPVPVGPNGNMMLIPRGRPVTVRHPYVEVLMNAKRNVGEQQYDESTGRPTQIIYREVSAYPWRILTGPHAPTATQAA